MTVQLKDIANYLNVSVSTVSRVVNGKGRVSKETQELILKTIKEMGYQPNEVARSLKRKKSNTLGVIVPDLTNNFYATVIKGIEKTAMENGFTVIVCNSDEDIEKEEEYVKLLLQKQISGLVIATVGGNPDLFTQYKDSGIPVVFVDNLPDTSENFDVVTIDNMRAAYDLVHHLIEKGHEEIAMITGPQNQSTAVERFEGFKKCMSDYNLLLNENLLGIGTFKFDSGYNIMRDWLENGQRPTALFAANNFLLYGAIKAMTEKGLNIPEDIAVVCFDANDVTGLLKPQITSIIQPAFKIGSIAAEIILRKEKYEDVKIFEKVVLEPELIINESTNKIFINTRKEERV
ncbi:LacI family DNA-binding transcriptional regulator [Aneurinibacillus sp. REN35]|uniref:LacI family DNA-binding transcriptional regulator n=1 Tax=Aneurinibacillus sp. REN35 TaxID=3237286 RepID=UPI0035283125